MDQNLSAYEEYKKGYEEAEEEPWRWWQKVLAYIAHLLDPNPRR